MNDAPKPTATKPIPDRKFRMFAKLDGVDARLRVIHMRNLYRLQGRRMNLAGAVISGCTARRINLNASKATGLRIDRTHMEHASLLRLHAPHITVSRTRMQFSDATGATFSFGYFIDQADCTGVSFIDATLLRTHIRYAPFAKFQRAKAHHAVFAEATLTGANATDGVFIHADFTGADVTDMVLKGADLTGAKITVGQILTTKGWETATFSPDVARKLESVKRHESYTPSLSRDPIYRAPSRS